jgi:hypothetical protein
MSQGMARSAGVCELVGFCTRCALVPKLKYWNAAKWTFAHQRINNLRRAILEGLGTRRAVCESVRAEKNHDFCTQKSFFKETEYSQVKGIPARAILMA